MDTRKLTFVLLCAAALTGCADDPTGAADDRIIRVDVTPAAPELALGDSLRLEAVPRTAAGPVQYPIAWSSSDTLVATVNWTGLVRTRSFGTATIRAAAGAVRGETTVRVATWDLLFYSFAGGGPLAETLVLPPGSGGFPERIFPVGRDARDAVGSPDGARIAYAVRDATGQLDIWVANRDGTGARALVTGAGDDEWPSWSPDGARIAFQSDRAGGLADIWVINLDGSGLLRLTRDPLPAVTNEVTPAWSPDGSRIAYASTLSGTYDIHTIRPDGTDEQRVTSDPGSELEPSWSPDGSQLAVRSVEDNEWDIAILRADGTLVRRIARSGQQRSPSWRADGRALAFSARSAPEEPWQVWTMSPDGSAALQQTPANFTGGLRPVWLKRR